MARKPGAPVGRMRPPAGPSILPDRRHGPPPRLVPADIIECYRLVREGNRLYALTLQYRDGRLLLVRLTGAYIRPLQRAFAAAVRRWTGLKLMAEAQSGAACRCAEAVVECILQGVHVHGLHDAVVVTLSCADSLCHAAFEAPLARALARDLRRLGAVSPPGA